MNHIFLDRSRGRLRLHLQGDLQFDESDERLYHEPLGLWPALLAAQRQPGQALRALVLGGGDGLAARELLRVPAVASVRLVDYDADIVRIGRTELHALNAGALHDPRIRIDLMDARLALSDGQRYDVIVIDLTYPRRLDDARVWRTSFFRRLRLALTPRGIVAINAISPEKTPRGYGCIASTLEDARLVATPYTFDLPSFREEGYGRWGFFFAARQAIEDEEWNSMPLPLDSVAYPQTLSQASQLPLSPLYEASPNRRFELLSWLKSPESVAWQEPFGRPNFLASHKLMRPPINTSEHFRRWMDSEPGRQSVDNLLLCLPGEQARLARQALADRREEAQHIFSELDLPAYLSALRSCAVRLPRQWVQELDDLQARVTEKRPSLEDLVQQTYRALAILLIVLLVAHLLFPDNLYAKGFGSHYSGGGGSDISYSYTDTSWRPTPYRFRSYGYRTGSVYDSNGQNYPALTFSDPRSGRPPVAGLLALSPTVQLLESGALAVSTVPPGYRAMLEPTRLRILTLDDRSILDLHPGLLRATVVQQLQANQKQVAQAIADHQRWLDWVAYAKPTSVGKEAYRDMERLRQIQVLLKEPVAVWTTAEVPPPAPNVPGQEIYSSIYFDGRFKWVAPDGSVHARTALPSTPSTAEDAFFYSLLRNAAKAPQHSIEIENLLLEWDKRMAKEGSSASY